MPRSKRRHINVMGPEDDDRILSKRVRSGSFDKNLKKQQELNGGVPEANKQTLRFSVRNFFLKGGMLLYRRVSKSEDSSSFNQKRCLTWFREYTTPDDPDTLGPEGMEKFCEDIGVEPENVVMLVLAWKMNARQMGFFSQQEWLKGLIELQCDTIPKLQAKLEYLRSLLNDPATFKSIYRYAYDFARDKDQRSMDIETAKAMLQLLLGKHWSLFSHFNLFLEQSKYKVINKDQWCNILEFSRTNNSDLNNYDVDGAWPVMLDEFVEWFKASKEGSRS